MSLDSTRRFSRRADWYSKYRPSYPPKILDILGKRIGFRSLDVVADIGSGTGLLSKIFLENGNKVFGVEPNESMRSYAEKELAGFNFVSVKGTAERTTLPTGTVDLIAVGQAIHWFDRRLAKGEFSRISRAGAHLCVIYNDRTKDRFGRAYAEVVRANERDRAKVPNPTPAYISGYFNRGKREGFAVPNEQVLDFEGLMGRLLSASYMPTPGERSFAKMRKDVRALFDEFCHDGKVKLRYDTRVLVGPVGRP